MNAPHQQAFNKESAAEHGGVNPNNLLRRQKDYDLMLRQAKIGDGHREENGYHRPGSNKK